VKRFRVEKVGAEPRRVRGYRTLREGSHDVRVALLRGGGTRAVSVLHPIGENPRLTYAERSQLPASAFAIPERRAYPLDTAARARDALSRVDRFGTASDRRRVRSAVRRRYPAIRTSA